MLGSVCLLIISQILSDDCPLVDGDSCSGLVKDGCDATSSCIFIPDNGCCTTDFCGGLVEGLYDQIRDQIPPAFQSSITEEFICKNYIDYCEWNTNKQECTLSECYQHKSTECPDVKCKKGYCPIGKLFEDGSQCCNPSEVDPPDCYNNNKNTWENCSQNLGCSFYSGNCYPDLCENIPSEMATLVKDAVKRFCYFENNSFRQDPCYARPAGYCYDNPACYFESEQCPFDLLTDFGTSTAQGAGCCAPDAAGGDKSACFAIAKKDGCVNTSTGACVWHSAKGRCLLNPCKTEVKADCVTANGCKWETYSTSGSSFGQCYPISFSEGGDTALNIRMHGNHVFGLASFLVMIVGVVMAGMGL